MKISLKRCMNCMLYTKLYKEIKPNLQPNATTSQYGATIFNLARKPPRSWQGWPSFNSQSLQPRVDSLDTWQIIEYLLNQALGSQSLRVSLVGGTQWSQRSQRHWQSPQTPEFPSHLWQRECPETVAACGSTSWILKAPNWIQLYPAVHHCCIPGRYKPQGWSESHHPTLNDDVVLMSLSCRCSRCPCD